MTVAILPHQDPSNTRGGRHGYQLARALRRKLEQPDRPLDGLEGEVDRELRQSAPHRGPDGLSFLVPNDAPVPVESRALTSVTGAGLIGADRTRPWLEALGSKLLVYQLGANWRAGLIGHMGHPRISVGSRAEWVGPLGSPAASTPIVDELSFEARRCRGYVDVTGELLKSSARGAELELIDDLTQSMARAIDRAALVGDLDDVGIEPIGILAHSSVPVVPLSANGGPPTHVALVEMEETVSESDGDRGHMAFVTSPKGRRKLRETPKGSTNNGVYLWSDWGSEYATLGYHSFASTGVPKNLTKGTGENLTALIFGDWTDLYIGQYGHAIEVQINPYKFDRQGLIRISATFYGDIQLGHPGASWVKIVDLDPSD